MFAQKKGDFSALDEYLAEEKKEKAKKEKTRNRTTDVQPLHKNLNRQKAAEESKGIFSATGVENAISALSLATKNDSDSPSDRNPEKRMKAAYMAFEERRLGEMKSEMPGLKRSQYKEKIWKEWQKSPENPMNQM